MLSHFQFTKSATLPERKSMTLAVVALAAAVAAMIYGAYSGGSEVNARDDAQLKIFKDRTNDLKDRYKAAEAAGDEAAAADILVEFEWLERDVDNWLRSRLPD